MFSVGQKHLFSFIMQYALHCNLAANDDELPPKPDELPPKPFQIFLHGGAGIGENVFYSRQ